jgi:NAD(P)-dependent dehydrogenase (short-subunit alcohol dehydrogenase family)
MLAELGLKSVKAVAIQLDVSDTKHFKNFFAQVSEKLNQHWKRNTFDFLINNAGIEANATVAESSEELFDSLMNVHFKGVYFLTQQALPYLADHGRIINLSTGLTRFTAPGYAAYASMKGAIEVFSRYLAKEVGVRGITVNTVAPGAIETDFTKQSFESHPELKGYLASQTALGRVGLPDDIGGAIAFLCTEEARWINAQRLEVSGGMFV